MGLKVITDGNGYKLTFPFTEKRFSPTKMLYM